MLPGLEGFRRRFKLYKVALWAGLAAMLGGPVLVNQLGSPLSSAAVLGPLVVGCLVTCGGLLALVTDMSYSTAPKGRRLKDAVGAVTGTLLLTAALVVVAEVVL